MTMKRVYLILLFLLIVPIVSAQDFTGEFEVDSSTVNLGDEFRITGNIWYKNAPLDSGVVVVRLNYQDMIIPFSALLNNGEVTASGVLTFNTENVPMPAGVYNVDVLVFSVYGDYTFTNVASLNLDNQLITTVELDKEELLPGDSITISGTAERLGGEKVNGDLRIVVDDVTEFNSTFNNGIFTYRLRTLNNIRSNEHKVKIYVNDDDGNSYMIEKSFSIIPVPTSLDLIIERQNFLPSNTVSINSILYDQADDSLVREVKITITNSKNEVELEQNTYTNSVLTYDLPQFALPGTWKIKGVSEGLIRELQFKVEEVKQLDAYLNEQILVIKNIGNVDYNDLVRIEAIGDKSKIIERRTNLEPDESISVSLYEDLEDGSYKINVLDETFDVSIKDPRTATGKVSDFLEGITGSVVAASGSRTSKTPFYIFLAVMVFVIFIIGKYRYDQSRFSRRAFERERASARRRKETLQKLKEIVKPRRFYGKASEADIVDFKARILQDIKSEDSKKAPSVEKSSYLRRREFERGSSGYLDLSKDKEKKDEDKKGGLFSMFDE